MDEQPCRSWHALLPYTPAILRRLPPATRPARYTRADAIPHTEPNPEDGLRPTVRDYHAINHGREVRVPKKIATPIRVEGKVWFANERSEFPSALSSLLAADKACVRASAWLSWLNISVLVGTLALALFNASEDNQVARTFAYTYAVISVGILVSIVPLALSFGFSGEQILFPHYLFRIPIVGFNADPNHLSLQIYGYLLYQHRITMIRRRDPGHFGAFPLLACFFYFPSSTQKLYLLGPVSCTFFIVSGVFFFHRFFVLLSNGCKLTAPFLIIFRRQDPWSGRSIRPPLLRCTSQLHHPW